MGISDSFEVFSRFLRQYQSDEQTVEVVDVTIEHGEITTLVATVDATISCSLGPDGDGESTISPQAATIDDQGALHLEFSPAAVSSLTARDEAVSTVAEDVRVTDGAVLVTLEVTIPATAEADSRSDDSVAADSESAVASMRTTDAAPSSVIAAATNERTETDQPDTGELGNDTTTDGPIEELQAARDEDLPPFEDTEYLQCLYDSFDTFDEMREYLDMDVAAETVRRYMIDADVHDPTSYDTTGDTDLAADDSDDAQMQAARDGDRLTATDASSVGEESRSDISDKQIVTDGIGFPEHLRIDDIIDAVVDSMTLYEVQRQLDLERKQARDLLEQLNVLDLVMRRVSQDPERPLTYELVTKRIRECTTTTAGAA